MQSDEEVDEAEDRSLEGLDRRLRPALMAFFLRRVGERAEAEDLTQEVFIRLARGVEVEIASPDSYIFRIAANLVRDKARRRKVRADFSAAKRLEDYFDIDPIDPFRIASDRQDLALLARAIADLPEKTGRIFTLYRIENIDKRDIAAGFGVTVRMVELHIQRAMVMLAEHMETNQ